MSDKRVIGRGISFTITTSLVNLLMNSNWDHRLTSFPDSRCAQNATVERPTMSTVLAVEISLESSRLAVVAGPLTWISGQPRVFENYEPT